MAGTLMVSLCIFSRASVNSSYTPRFTPSTLGLGKRADDRPYGRSSPFLIGIKLQQSIRITVPRIQVPGTIPAGTDQARSKRSRFMTLFQAATKSHTNACCESSQA